MYKPNFCSECGTKLLRLRWHLWTSRQFCNDCARRLRKSRLISPLFVALALLSAGYLTGRSRRPDSPPLIIERRSDSPLNDAENLSKFERRPTTTENAANTGEAKGPSTTFADGDAYLCGARTKKNTPCSRRVHSPVRCWQHKGKPAILPLEKLLVKD